jgi:hypothetical protein
MSKLFLAAALFALPAPTFAQEFGFGPGGIEIAPYHHHHHR